MVYIRYHHTFAI